MEWLNLKTSVLHAPEYIGSDPRSRSTWLSVILWCAQQENGGRVEAARVWKDRQWQQTCGVTRREVESAGKLLTWEGDALTVWNYPKAKETVVRERREIGRAGGLASGASRSTKTEATGEGNVKQTGNQMVQANGEPNASTEGKGREEEGKGKEGNSSCPTSALPPPDGEKFVAWFLALLAETEAPTPKLTPSIQANWAQCYDRMVRIDKRTKEDVKEVCRWARNDPFWKGNFLSPMKLRERKDGVMWFDVFMSKARSPESNGRRAQPPPARIMGPMEVLPSRHGESLMPPDEPAGEDAP